MRGSLTDIILQSTRHNTVQSCPEYGLSYLTKVWGGGGGEVGCSPSCAKTANDFTKRFYDIVSSSFAVTCRKKSEVTGVMVSRHKAQVGSHWDPPCAFQWES